RHLQHQLVVPLLRAPALRHRRRVAQPRLARAALAGRGVAQQPPRVPDLRRARPAPLGARHLRRGDLGARADGAGVGRRARQPGALRAGALTALPRVPTTELAPRGRRHSIARDRRAVRHHYDVSNDYFALMLDASLTYSCAIWSRGAETLEDAQRTKLELVCTK